MAWHAISKSDVTSYRSFLARRGRLDRCDMFTRLPDGRSATVQVYSQRGVNLMRRDSIWVSTDGEGVLSTMTWFGSDDLFAARFRGQRRAECSACEGLCCRDRYTMVPLAPDEVRDVMAGRLNWPMERRSDGWYLAKRSDGSCMYLSEKGLCKIYRQRRPRGCRVWYCGRGDERDNVFGLIVKHLTHSVLQEVGAKCLP